MREGHSCYGHESLDYIRSLLDLRRKHTKALSAATLRISSEGGSVQDHPAYAVDLSEVHFGGKTRVTIGNFEEFVSQQKNAVFWR